MLAKIEWEYLDVSSQNGVVIFISFWSKMFRCINTKRAGFEDLVMS